MLRHVAALGLLPFLVAGCLISGAAPTRPPATPTKSLTFQECGVPGTDPVFNAWSKACHAGDPRASDGPWRTIPPGYSPLPSTAESSVRPLPSAPIDASIEPVSKSDPGPGAEAALKACGVKYDKNRDAIVGMGLIPHAHDATKYARLFGTEPEIATDEPAWLIQFAGRIESGGYWANNPVCLFVDGPATLFAPEESGDRTNTSPVSDIAPDPPFRLPPLAP